MRAYLFANVILLYALWVPWGAGATPADRLPAADTDLTAYLDNHEGDEIDHTHLLGPTSDTMPIVLDHQRHAYAGVSPLFDIEGNPQSVYSLATNLLAERPLSLTRDHDIDPLPGPQTGEYWSVGVQTGIAADRPTKSLPEPEKLGLLGLGLLCFAVGTRRHPLPVR